jgi:nicotinate-nucleotide adenylyltransferase
VKKRIGIYSGTFDPIHSGHIAFALETYRLCNLDKVVLLPETRPRRKTAVTDIRHRTEIIKRAIASSKELSVASTHSDQFTVSGTLPELTNLFPDSHFTFLFGSDVVKNFSKRWEQLDQMLSAADLAIGMRAHDSESEIIQILEDLRTTHKLNFTYTLVRTTDTHVASSNIRKGFKNIAHLHTDVTTYIENNELYKSSH